MAGCALSFPHAAWSQATVAQDPGDAYVSEWEQVTGDPYGPAGFPRPRFLRVGDWWLAAAFEGVTGSTGSDAPLHAQTAVLYGVSAAPLRNTEVRVSGRLLGTDLSSTPAGLVAVGDLRVGAAWFVVPPIPAVRAYGFGFEGHVDVPFLPYSRDWGRRGVGGGLRVVGTHESSALVLAAAVGSQLDTPALGTTSLAATVGFAAAWPAGGWVTPRAETRAVIGTAGSRAELLLGARMARTQPYGGAVDTEIGLFYASDGAGFGGRFLVGLGLGRRRPPPAPEPPTAPFADRDECPAEREVVNGWQDEDGCPDALATLAVTGTLGGERLAGATFLFEGGAGQKTGRTQGGVTELVVTPGTRWSVSASAAAGCVTGVATLVALEGRNDVEVPLQYPAEARVLIVDEEARPVPGARFWVLDDRPPCTPSGLLVADDHGRVEFPIAKGSWTVTFTAPDHLATRRGLRVTAEGTLDLVAQLAPREPTLPQPRPFWVALGVVGWVSPLAFVRAEPSLDEASAAALEALAKALSDVPGTGVSISVGANVLGESPDAPLATARADAIAAALVGFGAQPEYVTVVPSVHPTTPPPLPPQRAWALEAGRVYPEIEIRWLEPTEPSPP